MDIHYKKRPDKPVHRGFIIAMLLLAKDQPYIIEKLKGFGYRCEPEDIVPVLSSIRSIASAKIIDKLTKQIPLNVDDDVESQWMRELGVYELIHFMVHKDMEDPPDFHAWIRDVVWINCHDEVQSVINAFIFNNEDVGEMSAVIDFKYRRHLTQSAIKLHQHLFFNPESIDARSVMYYCMNMTSHHMILRKIEGSQELETAKDSEACNGHSADFVFHDSNYIKWKLGYKAFSAPTATSFLESVMLDAMYKFQETMQMTSFIEKTEIDGTSPVTGLAYDNKSISRKNVEKEKAKLAKQWLDLFVKAQSSKPAESSSRTQELIKKLTQHELQFDKIEEQIVSISDARDILEDVATDITGFTGGTAIGSE